MQAERSVPVPQEDVLARFDPKVKVYLVLQAAGVMVMTMFGVVLLPIWVFAGPIWANLYFPSIEARLGARSLVYRHGVWFRKEMSIPLDKIQDVSLHHGPFLDALGLATLRIETAAGGQQGSNATLVGVVGAEAFRAAIIARRDAIALGTKPASAEDDVLVQIRDSLLRIEGLLRKEGAGAPPS